MKDLILIRVSSSTVFKDLARKIKDNNIECSVGLFGNRIDTKNLALRFVVIPIGQRNIKYIKGMRATGCIGFDQEATDYLTHKNNVCSGHELIEYILERENHNE